MSVTARLERLARGVSHELTESHRSLGSDWKSYGTDVLAYRALGIWPGMPTADTRRVVHARDGITIQYRRNRGDIQGIREVVLDDYYGLPAGLRPRTLVDLGANIGLVAVWYAKRFGVQQVIGVEPVPGNAALARENLAANGVRGEILEAAIGPQPGKMPFTFEAAS